MNNTEKVKELYEKGLTQEEIGGKLGMSHQGVQYHEKKLGIKRLEKLRINHYCSGCSKKNIIVKSKFLIYKNFFCGKKCLDLFYLQRHIYLQDKYKDLCHICKKTTNLVHKFSGMRNICLECSSKKQIEYRKTEIGSIAYKEANKRSLKKFDFKQKARIKVRLAIQKGILIKPKECSVCGEIKPIQGHHDDYSKPLDVIWFCTRCHSLEHKKT